MNTTARQREQGQAWPSFWQPAAPSHPASEAPPAGNDHGALRLPTGPTTPVSDPSTASAGWVKGQRGANRAHLLDVRDGMKELSEQHVSEPGLVVLDITAADEDTLRLVVAQLEERWATSGPA
ncbi:DUF6207 family protein, partial [Streptomyces griseus]|uniref:DUF6207 family protein n=1 Tax=Streptomyces griseus TaxID=1911 RepID=UPI0033EEFA58